MDLCWFFRQIGSTSIWAEPPRNRLQVIFLRKKIRWPRFSHEAELQSISRLDIRSSQGDAASVKQVKRFSRDEEKSWTLIAATVCAKCVMFHQLLRKKRNCKSGDIHWLVEMTIDWGKLVEFFFLFSYSQRALLYLLQQMALVGFLSRGIIRKRWDYISLSGYEPTSVELHQTGTF